MKNARISNRHSLRPHRKSTDADASQSAQYEVLSRPAWGRLLLSFIFVHEGWSLIDNYGPAVAYMQKFGLSATLLPAVILLQLGGGLLVAAGLATRLAAVALAAFCTFTALFFHRQFADGNQLLHFQKDLAIAGGFLALAVAGPGNWSVSKYLNLPHYAR